MKEKRCLRIALAVLILSSSIGCAAQSNTESMKRYLITDYGALADGKTVNTKSIQAAIDKCDADGGGTVVVPAGTFLSGAICTWKLKVCLKAQPIWPTIS